MKRQIFVVNATVVDANGTFNTLSGYPKTYDSRSYDNDIDKTRLRAGGGFAEARAAMSKVDTRQLQTVTLELADGFQIERWTHGAIADVEPAGE